MEKGWKGLPYYPISDFYAQKLGSKIYKIPVSVADDCPNRRGLKGMQTCVFCDVWGSAAREESFLMDLRSQIEKYHEHIAKKYKAKNFLVYFQAYTNTFQKLSKLREQFDTALTYDFVKGFVVGTRPDCLSKSVLNTWNEYSERYFVSVELGVQSFNDETLLFMRRGHTAEQSLEAIHKIASETKADLGIHLIFGNPGETEEEIIRTAELVSSLPINHIKLHNLHVLKNTPLEEMFHKGEFTPFNRIQYYQHVKLFLQHLSPRIAVHRLAAFSSRWDELVAPEWTADKMGTHQILIDLLRAEKVYQSQKFKATTEEDNRLCRALSENVDSSSEIYSSLIENLRSRMSPDERNLSRIRERNNYP